KIMVLVQVSCDERGFVHTKAGHMIKVHASHSHLHRRWQVFLIKLSISRHILGLPEVGISSDGSITPAPNPVRRAQFAIESVRWMSARILSMSAGDAGAKTRVRDRHVANEKYILHFARRGIVVRFDQCSHFPDPRSILLRPELT